MASKAISCRRVASSFIKHFLTKSHRNHRFCMNPISPAILTFNLPCTTQVSMDYSSVSNASEQTWEDLRRQHKSHLSNKSWKVLELDETVEMLTEEGATDIVVIQVPKEMCYVDYFIVITAMSPRHVASMTEMLNKFYKKKRKDGQPFTLIEGKRTSEDWQCVDMGNMVVHVMLEDVREEYNLEKLWLLGHKHDDLLQEKPSDEDIMKRLAMEGLNLMSMNEDTVKALGNIADVNPWDSDADDFLNEDDLYESIHSEEDNIKTASVIDKTEVLDDDDAFLV